MLAGSCKKTASRCASGGRDDVNWALGPASIENESTPVRAMSQQVERVGVNTVANEVHRAVREDGIHACRVRGAKEELRVPVLGAVLEHVVVRGGIARFPIGQVAHGGAEGVVVETVEGGRVV